MYSACIFSRHSFNFARVRTSMVVMLERRSTGVLIVHEAGALLFASAFFLETRLFPSSTLFARYFPTAVEVKRRSGSTSAVFSQTNLLSCEAKCVLVPFPSVRSNHLSHMSLIRSSARPVVSYTLPLCTFAALWPRLRVCAGLAAAIARIAGSRRSTFGGQFSVESR